MDEANTKPAHTLILTMSETGAVVTRVKDYEFEWKIRNFSLNERWYDSPYFTYHGESWWLSLYPSFTDGYIRLYLARVSYTSPIEVEFSVALETAEAKKGFERHKIKCFEKHMFSCIISRWFHISEFARRQREFLSSGCLTIVLTMKKAGSEEYETDCAVAECSLCQESLREDLIVLHKKCLEKQITSSRCAELVSLQNCSEHECQAATIKNENDTLKPSAFLQKNKILQDLKQMLIDQENCDVVLRVRDKEFSAHKNILAARSHVFASMFQKNMKETVTSTVDIKDIEPSCFPEFLNFLYCDEIENLSFENVSSLFTAASKYGITDLRRICLKFMKEKLSGEIFLRKTYLDSFQH